MCISAQVYVTDYNIERLEAKEYFKEFEEIRKQTKQENQLSLKDTIHRKLYYKLLNIKPELAADREKN